MKALSLWNPWAELMRRGVKRVETRPAWALQMERLVGCDLAICSTASTPRAAFAAAMLDDTFRDALVAALPDEDPAAVVLPEFYRPASVLAVVRVTAVLPMVEPGHVTGPCVLADPEGEVWGWNLPEATAAVGKPNPWNWWTDLRADAPFGHYEAGRVAIFTDELRPLEPVPVRGHQRVWELPEEVERVVREQLGLPSERLW